MSIKMRFPVVKPYLTRREESEVIKVLRSGWLTQGKYVKLLEEMIKTYNKVKHAFLLNSATSGLITAIKSLELNNKDEVIIPSFTFPSTANSVILGGAKSVFCDIDLETFNISTEKIEGLITRRTKAIMPVHEFGLPAEMRKIRGIAKKHGLIVIEDAACSLGAEYKGKNVGGLGNVGVFSFHPRKIITSGEGGCIVTNSSQIARKVEYLRNHGEYRKRFIGCGYNFRMSDIQAAILVSQFKRIEKTIQRRIKLALNYNKLLKPLEDEKLLRIPLSPQNCKHIYQSYVVLLAEKINRDRLKEFLRQKGVEVQYGTYCVPLLDFYRKHFNILEESYKNACFAYKHTLTLPLYHNLKVKEQEVIVKVLKNLIEKCAG